MHLSAIIVQKQQHYQIKWFVSSLKSPVLFLLQVTYMDAWNCRVRFLACQYFEIRFYILQNTGQLLLCDCSIRVVDYSTRVIRSEFTSYRFNWLDQFLEPQKATNALPPRVNNRKYLLQLPLVARLLHIFTAWGNHEHTVVTLHFAS